MLGRMLLLPGGGDARGGGMELGKDTHLSEGRGEDKLYLNTQL
jgi:hypothetical protein